MARRMTISQYNAEVRRINQKRRQAVGDYNGKVRKYNDAVRRFQRDMRNL